MTESPAAPTAAAEPPNFYSGTHYDLAASLGHQLMLLMHQMRREVESRMAEHGLTDAQWRPLWLIKLGRASTLFELARELHVDAGALTRLIDRLETKGLVQRLRSESDRRVVHLSLTDAGERAVAAVPPVLASVNNDFLRGFDHTEWQQLLGFVARLQANGQRLASRSGATGTGLPCGFADAEPGPNEPAQAPTAPNEVTP